MRRGRRGHGQGWFLTMAALGILLGGMGTVYASWTDRLESRMGLGTGAFHMAVSGKAEPEAWLLDAEGEPVKDCGAVLIAGKGQSEAEFRITSGILAEMLSLGGSLSLEFPLECGADGTVQAGGASMQESELRLEPEQVLFASGGETFLLPEDLAEPFQRPLPCLVRTEAAEGEDGICGRITLSLEDEGQDVLESWPEVLTMTETEWEQLVPEPLDGMELPEDLAVEDGESIGTDTGVVVVYSLKCSLYLDQAGAVETGGELDQTGAAEASVKLEPENDTVKGEELKPETPVQESDEAEGGEET